MPPASPPPRLRLIGAAACVHADGRVLALEAKDALLLAYLAIAGPTPRRELAALLWPDVDDDRARANLRQRMFRLRKALGVELLEGAAVAQLAVGVETDLGECDAGVGDLVAGVGESDAGGLSTWLEAAREHRRMRRLELLAETASAHESAGQLALALAAAQQLVEADRTSEHAHQRLMRLHYLRGDRSAALLAFDECEQMLKNEVGARPSAETLAMLNTVEQASAHPWVRGQALPAAVLRPPRMIGRDAEAAAVIGAWTHAQAFLVTGAAGVGKSRLLGTLFDERADILLLRARPSDDAVPLATLTRLAEALAERWPSLLGHPSYAQMLRHANESAPDPHGSIRSAMALAGDLLEAARLQGLGGVVLDDLQFADDASVDSWCEWLDRPRLAGLRFGFASRTETGPAQLRIEAIRQRRDAVGIALAPLGEEQTRALVESLALCGSDAPAVATALTRRIGGNPLHLLETMRSALEQHGRLVADRIDVPAHVLDLLEQRLRALGPDSLLLVRIAAVAGSDWSPELAQAVARRDLLDLADAWAALERQGILDTSGFAHDLMLEAAARLLPQPIRKVMHARVAEHLQTKAEPPARLAHHWLAADEPLAALPHLIAAARLAWRAGRGRETREAFFKAADIELARGEPDAAFALLFECIEAVGRLCSVTEFDTVIARLSPLVRTASQQARIVLLGSYSRYLHGDQAGSDRLIADALLLAISCGDRMVEAACLYDKGARAMAQGRIRDCVEHLSASATLYRTVGLEHLAVASESGMRMGLRRLGKVRELVAHHARNAAETAFDLNPVVAATDAVQHLLDQFDLGDAAAADDGAQAAWKAVTETEMAGLDLLHNGLALLRFYRLRGRWTEALAVDAEVGRRLALQGDDASELARERAGLYLDLGRSELARPFLEIFEADPHYVEPQSWHATALRWRYQGFVGAAPQPLANMQQALQAEALPRVCELVLAAGQWCPDGLSSALVEPLVQACTAHGLRTYLLPLQALQSWLLTREGDLGRANACVSEALHGRARTDLGAALPGCALWLARSLQGLDRRDEALQVARSAAHWICQRLATSVPSEFQASFRERNPVHRELLALAGTRRTCEALRA